MKQTVHNISLNQNLSKAGFGKNLTRKFFLTLFAATLAFVGMAQTYTTKADGNWNSTATWVGGVVPSATVAAGVTINIKHDVTFNLNSDLNISGTFNITNDTLRFASSYNNKIVVASTGILNVNAGGIIQDVTANKADVQMNGRLISVNSKISISKGMDVASTAKQTYTNSTLLVNEKCEFDGIDTISNSDVQVSLGKKGDFHAKGNGKLYVANAKITVTDGGFTVDGGCAVNVLATATNNYGFDLIKTSDDLKNDGTWNARIDAYCVGKNVSGSKATDIDFTRPEDCSTTSTSVAAPELSFTNPVLKSGTDKKQGAVYRFTNITTGVDAEIKLKKFSRSDIVMNAFDNSTLGWNKAFQPEFGLPGVVQPNQDWYIDFEMTFYVAGTNTKKKVSRADFTALDVDGDGWSIAEYASFTNPANVAYSTFSSLATTPAGSIGSSLQCPICHVTSVLAQCLVCHGTGEVLGIDCVVCSGDGVLYSGCNHPFDGIIGNVLQGPVQNYANIDTNGTAVMATFQYVDVDKINFRYGAKSGAYSSNGSGIRLNSLWSKSFSLAPWTMLPVKFESFSVMYDKGNAVINWQAQASEELSHFVVQRSTDGKTYTDVATVFADASTKYSYTNKAISSATGLVYYRLVSVDNTKETQYSGVKMIRLTKSELQTLAIATYPNPVVSDVRITLPNNWQGKAVTLQLYTVNGVAAKSIQLGSASQTETMNVSGLVKGVYVVKATCGNESAQQRIVKD